MKQTVLTQAEERCGRLLFGLGVSEACVAESKAFLSDATLLDALMNPSIPKKQKFAVIDALFEEQIRSFLKVLTESGQIGEVHKMFDVYERCVLESKNVLPAQLRTAHSLTGAQLAQMRESLCQMYGKDDVKFIVEEEPALLGGFVLTIGDMEYDSSMKGSLARLTSMLTRG